MPQPTNIAAEVFCFNHKIDYQFIEQLHQHGLIEITEESEMIYIPEDQLPELEKMVRLHFDMDINLEGIETIHYLLQRMEALQKEITALRNRLHFYER